MIVAIETDLHLGRGISRGERFIFRRIIRNIPPGDSLIQGFLNIDTTLEKAHGASITSLINIEVTSSYVADAGQIEDTGATDGQGKILFELGTINTFDFVANTIYYFSIFIVTTLGQQWMVEYGKFTATENARYAGYSG